LIKKENRSELNKISIAYFENHLGCLWESQGKNKDDISIRPMQIESREPKISRESIFTSLVYF